MYPRAKQSLYWPGVKEKIRNMVENCIPCQVVARSQQKIPATPIKVPYRPWQKIGLVHFPVQGNCIS